MLLEDAKTGRAESLFPELAKAPEAVEGFARSRHIEATPDYTTFDQPNDRFSRTVFCKQDDQPRLNDQIKRPFWCNGQTETLTAAKDSPADAELKARQDRVKSIRDKERGGS